MFFTIYLVGFIIIFGMMMGYGIYSKNPKCDANTTILTSLLWPGVLAGLVTYTTLILTEKVLKSFKA